MKLKLLCRDCKHHIAQTTREFYCDSKREFMTYKESCVCENYKAWTNFIR